MLFLDATYKLTELRLPVYLFLVEDSIGDSEVVGVCLVVNESRPILHWMLNILKKSMHPQSEMLRVIMADKDITKRSVITECFPNSKLLICLFHTLRSFKREISSKALNLKEGQQHILKELFQQMCYATTNSNYDKHYQLFKKSAPSQVLEYFDKNWHCIKRISG